MSLYYHGSEIREISDELYAEWLATGNPKANVWSLLPASPAYDPQTHTLSWDGSQWVVEPIPATVPVQVYGHQMRAVLRSRSFGEGTLWDAVLALVAGLPEPQRTTVDDSLRTAAVMRRDSPSIAAFAGALGLDAAYVDGLFVEADGVSV